jgi:alpha-glucosidase
MKALSAFLLLLSHAAAALAQWTSAGTVDSIRIEGTTSARFFAGNSVTQIRVLTDDLVRIRFVPGATVLPAEHSWAVVRTEWPAAESVILREAERVEFRTPSARVLVGTRPLRITVTDGAGRTLAADHPVKGMAWAGKEVRVWKSSPPSEQFLGFGEKAGSLERRDHHMTMWNSDIPGYGAATDPLYKSVPFFYGFRDEAVYGLFLDNPFLTSFDMGKEARDQYSFGAESGELDYYVFTGPTPAAILERFTELVGRMPLPPLWSLGYQQSRWSYTPASRVREIAARFRAEKIPCDVIYLDIDYMDGYRVFTWNPQAFPDPRRLIADLAREGFRIATIIDPGIKVDSAYAAYRTGLAGDHFVRGADGTVFVGDVWPGACAFPDFSNAAARVWWGDQFAPLVGVGVKGWWIDMNEPSVFNVPTKTIDVDALHRPDAGPATHAALHNVYGLQMGRATYDGARRHAPHERPFLLTRATYAGGQRYAAVWTGDNVASWEHLRMSLTMCLNLGASGLAFTGADIGGFIGAPTGELFARWLQLGVFTPLMRAHSVINEQNKEPWEFGDEITAVNRETIALRYRLLPYLYASLERCSRTGLPVMRPLIFDHPAEARTGWDETEFFFGDDLLVAPILWEGARSRRLYLPRGTWYDFRTGAMLRGDTSITVPAPLAEIPIFARAGSAIPTRQVVQYTGEAPVDPLTFLVFPPAPGTTGERPSAYYEDDGISFRYRSGEYFRREVSQRWRGDTLIILAGAASGTLPVPDRVLVFRVTSGRGQPKSVSLSGTRLPPGGGAGPGRKSPGWTYDPRTRTVDLRTGESRDALRMELAY